MDGSQRRDESTRTARSGVRETERLDSAQAAPSGPIEGEHPGYVVEKEIARGGMGCILAAYDRRHDRPVALKVAQARDARTLRRFGREAWITGRLQHPSIIPLYETGEWPTGEPFFAMKLVRGSSLADVVRERKTPDERLALLPNLIAMVDALAYAHGEGVVHRDVKPANVLVGDYGETVVIDWGLAKAVGAEEIAEESAAPAEDKGASGLTAAGEIMGTPSYMPPEQARGEALDARADVYALGACVYHTLGGVPPYDARTSREIVAKLLVGPPPSLGEIAPTLPPDLVAIVAKAMARAPEDRYATASEMAADMKRFAAGQLVRAHSYSLGTLAKRWAAKNRAALVVATALVATLAVFATVSVRRIVRERDRADAAARTVTMQRDAAEKLVAFMISDLRDRLERVGRLDVLGGVGKEVDTFYESIAPPGRDVDLATVEHRASALETLADVEAEKHDPTEARALYDKATALRHEDVERAGTEDARVREGELLIKRASFEAQERSTDAARTLAEAARSIGDSLLARDPASPQALALATRAHLALSRILGNNFRHGESHKEALAGAEIARRRATGSPSDPAAMRLLGEALFEVGVEEINLGRFDAPGISECIEVRERLVATSRDSGDRFALSRAYERRALGLRNAGSTVEAMTDATKAKDALELLVATDPENRTWLRQLGQSYDSLCSTQHLAGHSAEAIESCRKGIEVLTAVASRTPDAPSVHVNLLLAHQRLAWVFMETGRKADAESELRSSMAIATPFLASGQGDRFTARLADSHGNLAELAFGRGDYDEARQYARRALDALEPNMSPETTYTVRRTVVCLHVLLAKIEARQGRAEAAIGERRHALGLFVDTQLDNNAEEDLRDMAAACVGVLPTKEPALRALVHRAIAILEPLRCPGSDPAPRLALLAKAKRLLGPP